MTSSGAPPATPILHLYATGLHPELIATARAARCEGAGWRARAAILPDGGHLIEVAGASPAERPARAPRPRVDVRAVVLALSPDAPGEPEGLPRPGRIELRPLHLEPRGRLEDHTGALQLALGWSLEHLDADALAQARATLAAAAVRTGEQRLVHDGGHRENEAPGRWSRLDLAPRPDGLDAVATVVDPASCALIVLQLQARWSAC